MLEKPEPVESLSIDHLCSELVAELKYVFLSPHDLIRLTIHSILVLYRDVIGAYERVIGHLRNLKTCNVYGLHESGRTSVSLMERAPIRLGTHLVVHDISNGLPWNIVVDGASSIPLIDVGQKSYTSQSFVHLTDVL